MATFGSKRTKLRATQPKLNSMFYALFLKIALSAAEVMSFGHLGAAIYHALNYYLWGALKYKCYADKPELIDAIKGSIHDAIGEIQLHTIDDVVKNWSDRVGYCMASHLNEIIFHY